MSIKHGVNSTVAAAVFRRQRFLVKSLGVGGQNCQYTMQGALSGDGTHYEADAVAILRAITPKLDPTRHKGQAGKVAVIGGCREYTGAPYFAAISALKIGADLSHVFCTKDAAPVIKSYSPELIVHPILEESYSVRDEEKKLVFQKVVAEVDKWMERFDCLVIGPGLGRDPFLLDCVSAIIKQARQTNVPIVIDGDGLFLVTNSLDLISAYPLAVLTPNVNEYKRLVQKVLCCEVDDLDAPAQLMSLSKGIGNITILRKGKSDLISDGEMGYLLENALVARIRRTAGTATGPSPRMFNPNPWKIQVKSVSIYGSPRRCGGQGDILSGSVAVFLSWARQHILVDKGNLNISSVNPTVLGCIAASALLRKAASLAFEKNKRSTLTGDIIECLGRSLEDICPAS